MKFRIIYFRSQKKGSAHIIGVSLIEFSPSESQPRALLGYESDDESVWLSFLFLNFKVKDKTKKI